MACSKRVWASKAEAKRAARRAAAVARPGEMRPYRCVDCGAWHFGHVLDGAERDLIRYKQAVARRLELLGRLADSATEALDRRVAAAELQLLEADIARLRSRAAC